MGQRLLLVDSDRSFLKEHQVSLEAAFDLEVAGAPEGVVTRLESAAFAAVLICVEVADNKGYALCSAIRRNPRLDGLKIALISAKATEEEYGRHQSLKGRAADLYLHKPIAPSALVAALTPLVPGRALDPDNPLGELVDTELGDDWLDGLKSVLEDPTILSPAPVPGGPASSPASPEAPQDAGRRALLEELERSLGESEALRVRLAEAEAALRELEAHRGREGEGVEALKGQLKEALAERGDLIHQVETLNQQVGEKTQRTLELLKERDRLLNENLDLEPCRAKAQELEAALAQQAEVLAARQLELEAVHVAQGQLNATLEGMVEQYATLEGAHQAALLEVAGYQEKLHACQMEAAGLEATVRGQGRDLAELGARFQAREAELEASQAQVLEREQELLTRQEALIGQQDELTRLSAQLTALRQELDAARVQHEGERLEMMNALDQKEAEIHRLEEALAGQRATQEALEREKQGVHGQLSEHRDRLQALEGLLQEVQDKLRRGTDLAKG